MAADDFGQDHWDQDDSVDYRQTDNGGNDDDDDNNPTIEDLDIDDEIDDGGKDIFYDRDKLSKSWFYKNIVYNWNKFTHISMSNTRAGTL